MVVFLFTHTGEDSPNMGVYSSPDFLEEESMNNLFSLLSDFITGNDNERPSKLLPAFVGRIGRVPAFQQETLRDVAKWWNLNPLSGEIYAYSLGKDVPVTICAPYVSWVKIARQYGDFVGFKFIPSKDVKKYDIEGMKIDLPVWCKCVIQLTQNREVEFGVFTEEISARDFIMSSSPRQFLKYKAMVGAIRLALGVTGLCTPEEGRNLFETAQKEHDRVKTKDSFFRKVAVFLFG
jgi:hypothetical protein